MKKIFLTACAIALGALLNLGNVALAASISVPLESNSFFSEMSSASGVGSVDKAAGIVKINVKNLPKDSMTGKMLPINLTDTSVVPYDTRQTKAYQAYLLRVEQVEGVWKIVDGVNLGVVKVSSDRSGAVDFRAGGNLNALGYNMLAITAEEMPGACDRHLPELAGPAFTWHGNNGAIVLWGVF